MKGLKRTAPTATLSQKIKTLSPVKPGTGGLGLQQQAVVRLRALSAVVDPREGGLDEAGRGRGLVVARGVEHGNVSENTRALAKPVGPLHLLPASVVEVAIEEQAVVWLACCFDVVGREREREREVKNGVSFCFVFSLNSILSLARSLARSLFYALSFSFSLSLSPLSSPPPLPRLPLATAAADSCSSPTKTVSAPCCALCAPRPLTPSWINE